MISSSPTEIGCCPKCGSHEYLDDVGAVPYCINKKCSCHHSTTQKKETCPECQFEQPRYPHEKSAHQKDCSRAQKKECCAKARQEGYDDGRLSAIRDGLAKKDLAEEETPEEYHCGGCGECEACLLYKKDHPNWEIDGSFPQFPPTTLSRIDEIVASAELRYRRVLDGTGISEPYEFTKWLRTQITSLLSDIEERIQAGKKESHKYIPDDVTRIDTFNAALDSASEVVRSFKV